MKKKYGLAIPLLVAGLLGGCDAPTPEPSNMIDAITKSYQKTETSGSQEKIDSVIAEGKQHFEEYISRYRSAKDVSGAGFDVGIVPAIDNCPLWSEKVTIFVDNENDDTETYNSGWIGAWTVTANKDSYFKLCKVDGRYFNNMRGTFGIVKMGSNNPSGYKRVRTLLMDNEDGGSTNIETGSSEAAPNFVDGNKNLRLLFIEFQKANDGLPLTPYPDFGISYGVFGRPELGIQTGTHYTDDEDDNCATTESSDQNSDDSNISFRILKTTTPAPFRKEVKGTFFYHAKVK